MHSHKHKVWMSCSTNCTHTKDWATVTVNNCTRANGSASFATNGFDSQTDKNEIDLRLFTSNEENPGCLIIIALLVDSGNNHCYRSQSVFVKRTKQSSRVRTGFTQTDHFSIAYFGGTEITGQSNNERKRTNSMLALTANRIQKVSPTVILTVTDEIFSKSSSELKAFAVCHLRNNRRIRWGKFWVTQALGAR